MMTAGRKRRPANIMTLSISDTTSSCVNTIQTDFCMKYSISISFVLPDIDECLSGNHACDVTANCTNIDGSHNCTCKEGYTGDGQSCQGIITALDLANRKKKNYFLKNLEI